MITLPVSEVIDQLRCALSTADEAVLEAPPGAGKTTLVPLQLLHEGWLEGQKILMLEPRRLAARMAAGRMAQLLNEAVGETVGYRIRMDSKVGPQTRIEVVTEGILTRMLQQDPALEGVGLVIFDEFHERSLDADFGLALALQGRELLRDEQPLKLLLMSATLDSAVVEKLLPDAPVVRSEGRMYPVAVKYLGPVKPDQRLEQRVARAVMQGLEEESGSLLVFLPGQREIRAVAQALTQGLPDKVKITPLYGDLTIDQQQQAIQPAENGWRKIVLATNIAETSLTIEGVRVVIDAGLSRESRLDPASGMSRLHTRKLSRAASIQRMGRAGRMEPGCCYRLWSESQQEQLAPYTDPEILNADLAPLALQLARWGVDDPAELSWLNLPPTGALSQARELLLRLGALEVTGTGSFKLTDNGAMMADLPLHPRLSHMLLIGWQTGFTLLACQIAALLSERDPLSGDADLSRRIAWIKGELACSNRDRPALSRIRQLSKQFKQNTERRLKGVAQNTVSLNESQAVAMLLAQAYPDRIASRRGDGIDYRLSNGRAVRLNQGDALQKSNWLAVANSGGQHGQSSDRVFLAAALDGGLFNTALRDLTITEEVVAWDSKTDRMLCERQRRIGVLVIERKAMQNIPVEAKCRALIAMIRKQGLGMLPWNDGIKHWRQRLTFLRRAELESGAVDSDCRWPDLSDTALLNSLEHWLGPYLAPVNHINHFARLDLNSILQGLLEWPLPRELDKLAPERIQLPTGNRARIDYSEYPPVLAVKLQEMFGCVDTPTIGNGVALKIHLLSPARRPLQVTQDLASFWANSYREVQKDMKGRYPKHPWPDNPLEAQPSAGIKRKKHN